MMRTETRIALSVIATASAVVGGWALLFPLDFYDAFPGCGRVWISVDGPYNEHLVRDVGGLSLGMAVLAALSLWRSTLVSPLAVGLSSLAYNLPHFAYHMAKLGQFQPIDRIGNAAALGGALLCSLWLVMPAARAPR